MKNFEKFSAKSINSHQQKTVVGGVNVCENLHCFQRSVWKCEWVGWKRWRCSNKQEWCCHCLD